MGIWGLDPTGMGIWGLDPEQLRTQHTNIFAAFNKLLLNQPDILRAVGDEKSAVHTAGLPGRSALLPIPTQLAEILEYHG